MSYTEIARRLRPLIEKAAQSLEDGEALEAVELYPKWHGNGRHCVAGERLQHAGVLYTVLQTHESQASWSPDVSPSLFARVLIPDPSVIPDWTQPDSTNPYMKGDKVRHAGKNWESDVDNNVWEPGVYGWHEIA